MVSINHTVDSKGNSSWTFTAEMADMFNTYYNPDDDDEFVIAPGDKNHECYEGERAKNYPYPEKMSLWDLVDRLDGMSAMKTEHINEKLDKLEIVDAKEALKGIIEIAEVVRAYIDRCKLLWQTKIDEANVPADWMYGYLRSLADLPNEEDTAGQKFCFLKNDIFGETCKPVKILRVSFSSGNLMYAPKFDIKTQEHYIYDVGPNGDLEVILNTSYVSIPYAPIYEFGLLKDENGVELFDRNPDLEKLNGLGERYIEMINRNVELPELYPGTSNRTKYAEKGSKGPSLFNSSGRFVVSPRLVQEYYYTLDDVIGGRVIQAENLKGFKPWWLCRVGGAFSLKNQSGCLIPMDVATDVIYDKGKINNIFLNPEKKEDLMALVHAVVTDNLYGDPVRERANCLILLNGVPGTGKTSSIIALSEFFERPLIHLSLGTLHLGELSSHLERLFELARAFGANVLIDEADTFIYKRHIDSMERSSMVAKALSALEDFDGIVFLTSNVNDRDIDPAVKSRFTAHINFPDPDLESHEFVWKTNLKSANLYTELHESKEVKKLAQSSYEAGLGLRSIVAMVRSMHALCNFKTSYNQEIPSVNRFYGMISDLKSKQ